MCLAAPVVRIPAGMIVPLVQLLCAVASQLLNLQLQKQGGGQGEIKWPESGVAMAKRNFRECLVVVA